jgi:hypothetical protein
MMRAASGDILKVMGNRRAMVAAGPNPGKTPTRVPRRTPRIQKRRLEGRKAILKPR